MILNVWNISTMIRTSLKFSVKIAFIESSGIYPFHKLPIIQETKCHQTLTNMLDDWYNYSLILSFVLSIELTTFLEHSTLRIPTCFICYIYILNKNKAWHLLHFYSFEKSNFYYIFKQELPSIYRIKKCVSRNYLILLL